jgi:hypothetical protein
MKPFALVRVAAIVALLYAAGHTMGAPWSEQTPDTAAMLHTMKTFHFDAVGSSRTYWDFYFGFGLSISVFMFTQGIVLWLVATQTRTHAERMRPIIAVFAISFIANAVLAGVYFFIVPCVMAAIIAICLAWAWFATKPENLG